MLQLSVCWCPAACMWCPFNVFSPPPFKHPKSTTAHMMYRNHTLKLVWTQKMAKKITL